MVITTRQASARRARSFRVLMRLVRSPDMLDGAVAEPAGSCSVIGIILETKRSSSGRLRNFTDGRALDRRSVEPPKDGDAHRLAAADHDAHHARCGHMLRRATSS